MIMVAVKECVPDKSRRTEVNRRGVVTLWDLLTPMSLASVPGGAYAAAKVAKVANPYLCIAFMVEGLAVGILSLWFVRTAAD